MNKNSQSKAIIGIIAISIIALVVGGIYVLKNVSDENEVKTSTTASTESTSTTMMNGAAMMNNYKDGTYTATGKYYTPGGEQQIEVTIELQNGKITSSSINNSAAYGESRAYQQAFSDNYKKLVQGKSIATLKLTRVSGSSLTPQGFNEAIDVIKTQATKS